MTFSSPELKPMAFKPTNYNENGENGGALSLPALDLNGNSKGNSNGSSSTTNNIELIESKKKSSNTSTTTMTALDLNIDTDVEKNKEQKEELSAGLSSSTGSITGSIGSSMPDNSGTVSGRTSPALNTLSVESYNHKPRQNSRSLLKKSMTDATRLDRVSKIKIANAVPQNVVCNLSIVSL